MPLSDLSPEQQQAFNDRLKELGMGPSQVVPSISPKTHPGPVIFSADPEISTIPPHVVTVNSLDEVKRIAGNPDSHYESGTLQQHHDIFEDWPTEKNEKSPSELEAHENQRIIAAEMGYIYGHSKHYESYKTIIEKHKYPARFAVFAAEDVCVDANNPLYIKSEGAYNFGTVTICQGGSIIFEANATMTVQLMIKSNATSCS
jgi:hypothetical protein